jgi:Obg family GTPase CgtA-like protein
MLSVTNMREPESLRHFFYVLRAMGIIEALLQHDLQVGDEVVIGKCSFTYGDEMF